MHPEVIEQHSSEFVASGCWTRAVFLNCFIAPVEWFHHSPQSDPSNSLHPSDPYHSWFFAPFANASPRPDRTLLRGQSAVGVRPRVRWHRDSSEVAGPTPDVLRLWISPRRPLSRPRPYQ